MALRCGDAAKAAQTRINYVSDIRCCGVMRFHIQLFHLYEY
jgi:hypothetical protein